MKLVLKSKLEHNIHEISFKSFESYQNTKVDLSIQNLKQPITANLITEYEKINSLELEKFKQFLKRSNIQLVHIYSNSRETILSGKSLRIDSTLINKKDLMNDLFLNLSNKKRDILHKGTIRSGDRISSNGDLIVIGDVNPGAIVSAKKNVYVWGKLLGIALAGEDGNKNASITSLYLNPLQLRICEIVAVGPKEKPKLQYPEIAVIEKQSIIIKPYLIGQ